MNLDIFPDLDSLFPTNKGRSVRIRFSTSHAFQKMHQTWLYYLKNMQILHLNVMW